LEIRKAPNQASFVYGVLGGDGGGRVERGETPRLLTRFGRRWGTNNGTNVRTVRASGEKGREDRGATRTLMVCAALEKGG